MREGTRNWRRKVKIPKIFLVGPDQISVQLSTPSSRDHWGVKFIVLSIVQGIVMDIKIYVKIKFSVLAIQNC